MAPIYCITKRNVSDNPISGPWSWQIRIDEGCKSLIANEVYHIVLPYERRVDLDIMERFIAKVGTCPRGFEITHKDLLVSIESLKYVSCAEILDHTLPRGHKRIIACATSNGSIHLPDYHKKRVLFSFDDNTKPVHTITISPDSRRIIYTSSETSRPEDLMIDTFDINMDQLMNIDEKAGDTSLDEAVESNAASDSGDCEEWNAYKADIDIQDSEKEDSDGSANIEEYTISDESKETHQVQGYNLDDDPVCEAAGNDKIESLDDNTGPTINTLWNLVRETLHRLPTWAVPVRIEDTAFMDRFTYHRRLGLASSDADYQVILDELNQEWQYGFVAVRELS